MVPGEKEEIDPPSPHLADSGTDYALEFDGVDDYATCGTAHFPFSLDPQTLSLWVSFAEVTDARQSFVTLRRDRDAGVELGVRNGRITAWRYYDGSAYAESPAALPIDTWHHVAYVYDGETNRLYVDGALAGESTLEPNDRTPTSAWLGSTDGRGDLFRGKLDEVRVWDVARSAEQIAAEAAGSVEPEPAGLVMHLTFDESGGARVFDRSGTGNHATLGDGIAARMPARVPSDSPLRR